MRAWASAVMRGTARNEVARCCEGTVATARVPATPQHGDHGWEPEDPVAALTRGWTQQAQRGMIKITTLESSYDELRRERWPSGRRHQIANSVPTVLPAQVTP